jgi:hypothetical protein
MRDNAMRGGTIENIHFRNMEIGEIADAVLQIDFNYEEGRNGPEHPVVRNISIREVTCKKAKYALNQIKHTGDPVPGRKAVAKQALHYLSRQCLVLEAREDRLHRELPGERQ